MQKHPLMDPTINYDSILQPMRFKEEPHNPDVEQGCSSDKSRVIFSSSFRRLQQKAQVFGLETNSTVRSRLTHTLEVANTGSLIAKKVAASLIASGHMQEKLRVPFIDIAETCCLLHDIGNPPFGHFGEAAIKKWFSTFAKSTLLHSTQMDFDGFSIVKLLNDFAYFDGNPQGIRIILHLQDIPDHYEGNGLNLTYSQILSCVKYNCDPSSEKIKSGKYKKPGYFHSEQQKVKHIKNHLGWQERFPITFIMEAADDISYCLSDIEDGIEKGIISPKFFFGELLKYWEDKQFELLGINVNALETKFDFYKFKIAVTRSLIQIASDSYIGNQSRIKAGDIDDLFDTVIPVKSLLKALKIFARTHLFRSKEAENIELAGYRVISCLMAFLKPLLELPYANFNALVDAKNDINILSGKNLDVEWRLYNRLPRKHLDAYDFAVKNLPKNDEFSFMEWYFRAHLLVDYISGMTDNYALETYHLLNGTKIQ